jgi:trehalose-6-phosphatase
MCSKRKPTFRAMVTQMISEQSPPAENALQTFRVILSDDEVDEFKQWCVEHPSMRVRVGVRVGVGTNMTVAFTNDNDQLLFKMRWSDAIEHYRMIREFLDRPTAGLSGKLQVRIAMLRDNF